MRDYTKLSKVKPKCRKCGNSLHSSATGRLLCDNRYCPTSTLFVPTMEMPPDPYQATDRLKRFQDSTCPYCRSLTCICEANDESAHFDKDVEPSDPEGWEGGFARNH